MKNPVHHIELWTHDLAAVEGSFEWLLASLGWAPRHDPEWPQGRTWHHETGAYLVLEQSPAVSATEHDRLRPGLNHLAFRVADRDALDTLREQASTHGWSELFAESYPHASGEDYTALYLANAQGFEMEIVVDAG